jgi:putative ABC transport system permease protein
VVLAAIAFLLALVIAYFAMQIIVATAPGVDIPELHSHTLNGRALAFTAGLSILTGLVFSVFPAFAFSTGSLRDGLQEGGRNSNSMRHNRVKAALVIGEISLTLALLVWAATGIRSFVASMMEQQNCSGMAAPLAATRRG